MAKNALVIKGANFLANKLTTVSLDGTDVPCTALELSESSKTVTAFGDFTLTATKTPENATDALTWESSDTSVATVADGVVSVIGLGTATITATCGNQTATCAVACNEITIAPYYMFAKRQALTNYPHMYGVATSKRELTAADNTNLETVRTLKNQSSSSALDSCPIMLPPNTGIVELSYGSNMRSGTIYFAWMDTTQAGDVSYPNCAYLVSLDDTHTTAANTPKTWEYEKVSGADSFAISITTNSVDFSDSDTPDAIATAREIVIKCKPAASA